jgi:hypothetical protein
VGRPRQQPSAQASLEIGDDARAWDCEKPPSRAAAETPPSRATRVNGLRAKMSFMEPTGVASLGTEADAPPGLMWEPHKT